MAIRPPLLAHRQPSKAVEPGQGPLHHPAIPPQALAALDPFAGDPHLDPPSPQRLPTVPIVVAFIGMPFRGTLPRSAAHPLDRRDLLDQRLEYHRIMDVGGRQHHGQRDLLAVDLRFEPGLPVSVGFGPVAWLPFWPEARHGRGWPDSNRSGRPRRAGPARPGASAPKRRFAASRLRRCHGLAPGAAVPKGMPLFKTKLIPVSTAQFGTRGRPPFGFRRFRR